LDIVVQRGVVIQEGKPASVNVLLLDDNNEVKGTVHVYPKLAATKDKSCEFRVEINKGGLLGPVDIKVII